MKSPASFVSHDAAPKGAFLSFLCAAASVALLVSAAAGTRALGGTGLESPEALAAAQRVLEAREDQASTLARAIVSVRENSAFLGRLAGEALESARVAPDLSANEPLQRLLLERARLRVAYETVQEELDGRPSPAGRLAKDRRAASREGPRRNAPADRAPQGSGEEPFHAVGRLLDLTARLDSAAVAGDAREAARLLREVRTAAARVERLIPRDPPRSFGVVVRSVPEVRRDAVPYDPGDTATIEPVAATELPPGARAGEQITPEIAALAADLGYDPLAIYLHVRNEFRFETYFGSLKGAQATLETGGGNDYDLAALAGSLLSASGYNVRYARGTAIVPAQAMIEWLGLEDAAAANPILNTAGIWAVAVVSGSEIVEFRVDRFWVEVEVAPRPGAAPVWVPLDTAFKRHDLSPGIPGMLAAVPFDEPGYLSETRAELAWEFYSGQVRDYVAANLPGSTLADVPLGATPIPEEPGGLPRSLPCHLYSLDAVYSSIPSTLAHKATIRVRYSGATQFSHPIVLPESALQRITVSYAVDPADQGIVDGYGGLANTPAGAVDVIPQLKLDGALVAQGGLIPYLYAVTLEIDFYRPGDLFDGTEVHTVRAGEWAAVGIDAFQISQTHLQRQADTIVAATALEDSGGTADPDDLIGAYLYLAIMQYHDDVRTGDEALNALSHFRQVRMVSEGIALANQQIVSVGGTPFTTLPGGLVVDVPRLSRSSFALDDDNTLRPDLGRIAGFNGSAQEHALWENLLNVPGISTIKSLQLANERGIPVFVIDDGDVDPSNDCSILCPQLTLGTAITTAIQNDVAGGRRVTVPRDPTPLHDWDGVGYITEDPVSGSAGYIIYGGLYSGGDAGSGSIPPPDSAGGAVTIILEDGTILVIPAGLLGDATGSSFTGDPVNIANGNFYREEIDFSIPALGEPLSIRRYYNSQSTFDGPFGPGWTHQYSDQLVPQPDDSVIWINNHGTAYAFLPDAVPGTYLSPAGLRYVLTSGGGGYTLRRYDGLTVQFDTAGRMTSRADRNGNASTFSYDGSDRLATVSDPASRTLTFAYGAADRIATITDFSGRAWTYGYDASDRLASVTSPSDGQTPAMVTQYAYNGENRIAAVTEPNGGVRTILYYANGRVARVVGPEGGWMTLVYNPYKWETWVTDALGFSEVHEFNDGGNLVSLTHSDGTVDRWTYADNRMTAHIDPLGGTTTYEYDGDGNLIRSVDPTLRETTYAYEPPFSSLTRITRPVGREMAFSNDASGNVITMLDPELGLRTMVNNAAGLPETVTDAKGVTTTLTYDVDGQVATKSTPPLAESFDYDPRGTLSERTDGNSHTTAFSYDLLDRVISTTDAELNVEQRVYDAAGQLIELTDPRGAVTQYEYDLNGRVTRIVNPDGSSRQFAYDAVGNLVAETDELGRTTSFTYDSRNRSVRTRFPDGGVVRQRYDAVGRLVSTTDPLGNQTGYEYDAAGRLTRSTDALGHHIDRTYDAAGNLETITDRRGAATEFLYDGNLRNTRITGAEGRLETFDYDANGYELERTRYDVSDVSPIPQDPRTLPDAIKRRLVKTYDDLNRVETEADPEGGLTQFAYDPVGNVTSVTDPRMNTTSYEYTNTNLVNRVTQPDTGESRIEYDAAGNRVRLETPTGGVYRWEYDNRNRVTSSTDPLGNITRYEYDLVSNLTRRINPDGSWVRRSYDAMNRVRRIERSDGTWTEKSYDLAGNLVRATTERTVLTLAHDSLNRLIGETLTMKGTDFVKAVVYGYDEESNLVSVTDPEGRALTYGYDLGGQLTSVGSTTQGLMVQIVPDGYAQRGSVTYGNGTAGTLQFDKNGRPTSMDWGGSVAQFGYARDAAGNPTTIAESVGGVAESLAVSYDTLNRPLAATASVDPLHRSESFAYDLNGNLTDPGTGETTVFNPANQPVSAGADAYVYDRQGNRSSLIPSAGPAVVTRYDPQNRIVEIREGGSTTRLTYDALDRPVEINRGGTITYIVQAKENRLVEYDAGGNPVYRYTMSPRLDDAFAVETGAGVFYLHGDAIGSVRAVTDGMSTVVGTRQFGLFGRPLGTTGTPDLAPLGFAARPFYLGGALVDQRARLYDAVLGVFLSVDPLGVLSKAPNPYSYANNRPSMFVDPLGLMPEGPSLWNRIFGALRLVGGVAEGALGIAGILAPEPTMLTKVAGGLLIAHSLDQIQAGLRQLWTGEATRSLTSQGLGAGAELLGASETTAYYIGEFGDAAIGIVLTLGTSAGLQAASSSARIGATGEVGEAALRELGGESQVFFRTSQGARYVDQVVAGVAHESKVGYTSLTQSVARQIAKDAELVGGGQVQGAVWHFFRSPMTGQVGPSGPLLNALREAGITAIVH